jgi:glycerol-1-phosphate dehydrogenase [NAD(P)+]
MTRFYEQLLAQDFSSLNIEQCVRTWPSAECLEEAIWKFFASVNWAEIAVTESRAKHIGPADLRVQLHHLQERWPEIRARLRAQLLPSAELARRLALVGAPTEPEQIGISRARLRHAFSRAHHIRRRFTVLDLADRADLMKTLLAGLFAPGACWDIRAEPAATAAHP